MKKLSLRAAEADEGERLDRFIAARGGISRGEAIGKTSAELNIWVDPVQRDEFMNALRRARSACSRWASFWISKSRSSNFLRI